MDQSIEQLKFLSAKDADIACLGEMNHQLIQDEGHRNSMSIAELQQRMSDWLENEYTAFLIQLNGQSIGYALFRSDPGYVYLRQLFVDAQYRRQGIGRQAMQWLNANVWKGQRVRVDVLVKNEIGVAFWKAVGFQDYCLTLEYET